jgi:predicted nucleotidyltransferase
MTFPIQIPADALASICRRYGVRRLSLFGSVLRPDFDAESDVDMLVEFLPGHRIGLFALASMERELTALLGRKVDLRTPNDLSPYFRDAVVHSAVEQYAA